MKKRQLQSKCYSLLSLLTLGFILLSFSPQKIFAADWEIGLIDNLSYVGKENSIATDSSNNYLVSYLDENNGDLKFAISSDMGATWFTQTVDSVGSVGYQSSLAIDSNDNYLISYHDWSTDDLKFAKSTDRGLNWSITTIDGLGRVGRANAIAVDNEGTYLVAYQDYTNDKIKYAVSTNGGDSWTIDHLSNQYNTGGPFSLTTDDNNNFLLTYVSNGVEFCFLSHDTTIWSCQTIDNATSSTYASAITTDINGNYLIKYINSNTKDIKIASSSDLGLSWNIASITTDSGANTYYYLRSPFVTSSTGDYYIVYIEDGTWALKIAKSADFGQTWTFHLIDDSSSWFLDSSASFDQDGNLIIAYYDADNGNLKFAKLEIDSTPPTLDTPQITPSLTGATITWNTDELASSQAEYGLTTAYGQTTAQSNTDPRVTEHSVILSNLLSCTTYHMRAISEDSSTNTQTGSDTTFTTLGCTGTASVGEQLSQSMTIVSGGNLSLNILGFTLTLSIPPAFSSSDTVFQIKQLDPTSFFSVANVPSGKQQVGNLVLNLSAYSAIDEVLSSFTEPLSITMTYTDEAIRGLLEDSLTIYRYTNAEWVATANCSINTTLKTVTCQTSGFSDFILAGQPTTSSSSSLPSPAKPPGCGYQQPLGIPDLFEIKTTKTSATLYFAPVSDIVNKYYIAYGEEGQLYQHGVEFTPDYHDGVISYTINDLNPTTPYSFTVRGGNHCAPGNWSQTMTATTTTYPLQSKQYYWY